MIGSRPRMDAMGSKLLVKSSSACQMKKFDSSSWLFGDLPAPVNPQPAKRKAEGAEADQQPSKKSDVKENAQTSEEASAGMSASQVANIFCDMFSMKGRLRMDNISRCFSDDVNILPLFTADLPENRIQGRTMLMKFLSTLSPKHAEAECRIFIEPVIKTPTTANVSMSLDFYGEARCPGWHLWDVAKSASLEDSEKTEDTPDPEKLADNIVLYKVDGDKFSAVWVVEKDKAAEVRQALTAMKLGGVKAFVASEVWRRVIELARGFFEGSGGLRCAYSDYRNETDNSGVGIGSVSACETWTEECGGPSAAEIEANKAKQAFERLLAHLSNESKFLKACKVLCNMLGTSVNETTRGAAFLAVRAAMGPGGARLGSEAARAAVDELLGSVKARGEEMSLVGGRAREMVGWWRAAANWKPALLGDDTFAFAKAAKEVQQALEQMSDKGERYEDGYIKKQAASGPPGALDHEVSAGEVEGTRANVLLEALKIMVRRYHFAWAKSPVDMVFRVVMDPHVRDLFGMLRPQVEELQDGLAKKRQAVIEKQSALEYQTAGFQHGRRGW